MKISNNLFKNLGKVVLVLSVFLIASCSDDDDGETGLETFVTLSAQAEGSYVGSLGYTPADGMGVVAVTDGTATISQSGNSYTISFSDGVPSITGLRFLGSDGDYASVSTDGSSLGISIDNGELAIGATIGGNTWGFSGDK